MIIDTFQSIDNSLNIPTLTINENINEFHIEKNHNFKIIHMNIRSARKNFDEFCIYLQSFPVKYDIIILTEAWLNDKIGLQFTIEGYNSFYSPAVINKCDGVIVFCRSEISLSFAIEQQILSANSCISSFTLNNMNFVINSIYRPPSCKADIFVSSLNSYLESGVLNKVDYYIIIGDINIDISESNNTDSTLKDEYLNILGCNGFLSAINEPTRVTEESKSCIDHCFVKTRNYSNCIGVIIPTNITDHSMISLFIETPHKTPLAKLSLNKTKKIINFINLDNYLKTENWDNVLHSNNPDVAVDLFQSKLSNLLEKSSVTKNTHSSNSRKIKSWISLDLISDIRTRDKLKNKLKKQPQNIQLRAEFSNFRTRLQNQLRRQKIQFYKDKIKNCEGDLGKTWSVIKEITNDNKSKTQVEKIETSPNNYLTDPHLIANFLIKYYSNVATNISAQIPLVPKPDESIFPTKYISETLTFESTNEPKVLKHIGSLKNSKSSDPDNINSTIYKRMAPHLCKPITHIINCCYETGQFPSSCKQAYIQPIFKGGNKTSPENWRPICILSTLSKIIEKDMKCNMTRFANTHNLFSPRQFGFREKLNSQHAILTLVNSLHASLNKSDPEPVIVIFLDLQKVFDTIQHDSLLDKMSNIGFRGNSYDLLHSYLADRKCKVRLYDSSGHPIVSDDAPFDCGIPQGTCLGPLNYLFYADDLCLANIDGTIISFADDTAIVIKGKTWSDTYHKAQDILIKIKNWLDYNKLSLNLKKTAYVAFSRSKAGQPQEHHKLIIPCSSCEHKQFCNFNSCENKCTVISKLNSIKYLGVTLDENLKWNLHTQITISRLRKTIYKFLELRDILSTSLLRQIYFGIVQSIVQYAVAAWGGTYTTYIKKIITTMNCLIKIALKRKKRYPTNLIYDEFDVPHFLQIYTYNLIKDFFQYDVICGTQSSSQVATTRLRAKNHLLGDRPNFELYKHSPMYKTIKVLNSIPDEIKNSYNAKIYKKKIKEYIYELTVDEIQNIFGSTY